MNNMTQAISSLSISEVLNYYLYGTSYTPDSPDDRIRDIPVKESLPLQVDAVAYMIGLGRYANLARAPIVSAFFNAEFSPSTYNVTTSSDGLYRLKLEDIPKVNGIVPKAHLFPFPSIQQTYILATFITEPSYGGPRLSPWHNPQPLCGMQTEPHYT